MDFQVYNDISQILNVAIQEDDEDTNDNKLRTKYGKHTFTRDYVQKYEGQFLYNNIHGKGKYTWTCQNDKGLSSSKKKITYLIKQFFIT